MKTLELIKKLQQNLEELGDLEVRVLLDSTNNGIRKRNLLKILKENFKMEKTLYLLEFRI